MTPRPASLAADIQGSEEHHPSIGRVTRREDFERLLAVRPCARSTHFLVHRLALASMQMYADNARIASPHQTLSRASKRAAKKKEEEEEEKTDRVDLDLAEGLARAVRRNAHRMHARLLALTLPALRLLPGVTKLIDAALALASATAASRAATACTRAVSTAARALPSAIATSRAHRSSTSSTTLLCAAAASRAAI